MYAIRTTREHAIVASTNRREGRTGALYPVPFFFVVTAKNAGREGKGWDVMVEMGDLSARIAWVFWWRE